MWGPNKRNIADGVSTDIDGMAAYIDNYCAKHPLENLDTATNDLVDTLVMRSAISAPAVK
jgi:hypothetical protein